MKSHEKFMNTIFKLLQERFSRLTFPQKFNVVTVIFILPLVAFIPLLLDQNTRIDHYGRKELFGALYLRPLWQLTEDLQTHELISQKYTIAEAQFSDIQAAQSIIDTDFQNLERIHNEYRETLPLGTEVDDLRAQWLVLKTAVQNGDVQNIQTYHLTLFNNIRELIAHVGDISYLILDPDLDTYYMMDSVLLKLPENQALLFEIRKLAGETVSNGSLSAEDLAQLAILLSRVESNIRVINRNIEVALENNDTGAMRPLVSQPLQEYQSGLLAFMDFINSEVASPSGTQVVDPALNIGIEDRFNQARKVNVAFYTSVSEALEAGIATRVNSLTLRFYLIGTIALLSVLAAFTIGQTIMNAISQPLIHLATATQRLASGDMTTRIPVENTDELGQVSNAFNQMVEELERDKLVLNTRSLDLELANKLSEKRAQELQAISEISRLISAEQRLDTLLALITRLVSEKFDFYHVGIFLIDNARQFAVLQAANSEAGQQMLERGHKLEVGQMGIVGNVAHTSQARIALDVGSDAVYFDNPDLPNTRSEMALPLNLRGQTLGVLDVQSLTPGAFNESDANTLGILADHIAIAIDNARLFEQSRLALSEVQTLYRQYQAQEWDAFMKQENKIGYHQLSIGGKVLEKPLQSDEIQDVIARGEILVINSNLGKSESSMVVPVKLRGQVIGVLKIKAPTTNRTWNQDEINLAEAISERLAIALDNARLLQDSQRRAAKEQKIGDVTAKIGASINMRSMLRTAVEELGRALPGSEVVIQFESDGK
jgi:GAF domain-containing protein/HAMP domain-containing protein